MYHDFLAVLDIDTLQAWLALQTASVQVVPYTVHFFTIH